MNDAQDTPVCPNCNISDKFYVCPLNQPFQGPFEDANDALQAVSRHMYMKPEARQKALDEMTSGAPGPWHVVYGFNSVTIQREAPT